MSGPLVADSVRMDQRYYSGEEIHIGDRVLYGGSPATIALVIDREECLGEESMESRSWCCKEHGSGFLITQDNGTEILLQESEEGLIFVSRPLNSS